MDTVVIKGGKFTFSIISSELSRGLRASARAARGSEYLTECVGAVGVDGTLRVLDALSRIDTSAVISDGFPFPQLFVLKNTILVCGLKKIYEWNGTSFVLKYTATTPGGLWQVLDFYDYICLSNGAETVVRDAGSKVYAIDSTLPTFSAACDYNGQVMIGAPNITGLGASLCIGVGELDATATISCTYE